MRRSGLDSVLRSSTKPQVSDLALRRCLDLSVLAVPSACLSSRKAPGRRALRAPLAPRGPTPSRIARRALDDLRHTPAAAARIRFPKRAVGRRSRRSPAAGPSGPLSPPTRDRRLNAGRKGGATSPSPGAGRRRWYGPAEWPGRPRSAGTRRFGTSAQPSPTPPSRPTVLATRVPRLSAGQASHTGPH